MKLEIQLYKTKFKITEKEKEDYFRWYWLPEPEIKTKADIGVRLERLRLQVAWTRLIADKYNSAFLHCDRWKLFVNSNEIVIL